MERLMMYRVLILLCMGQVAWAGSLLPSENYASIAFSTNEIRLPRLSPFGWCKVDASLDCHFYASGPYQVNVSCGPFVGETGAVIGGESAAVQVNGVSVPLGSRSVPLFLSDKSTPEGGIEIPLRIGFSFKDLSRYAGGTYSGDITFTVFGSR